MTSDFNDENTTFVEQKLYYYEQINYWESETKGEVIFNGYD